MSFLSVSMKMKIKNRDDVSLSLTPAISNIHWQTHELVENKFIYFTKKCVSRNGLPWYFISHIKYAMYLCWSNKYLLQIMLMITWFRVKYCNPWRHCYRIFLNQIYMFLFTSRDYDMVMYKRLSGIKYLIVG